VVLEVGNVFELRSSSVVGFYAGMSAAMMSVAPYMGLNFGFYEFTKHRLQNASDELTQRFSVTKTPKFVSRISNAISFASGAIAGGLSKTIIYPLDTVKKRLQAEVLQNTIYDRQSRDLGHDVGRITTNTSKYVNFGHCLERIFREEGMMGFYKGYAPTLLKSVFSTSIAFGVFEIVKVSLRDRRRHHTSE
jgi:hypothetical protein